MKKFLALWLLILVHGCGCPGVFAQTSGINSQAIFEGIDAKNNFVKNPFGRANSNDITVSSSPSASKNRVLGTAKVNGISSLTCAAAGVGGYCQIGIKTPFAPYNSPAQTCEAKIVYEGTTSALYSLSVQLNGSSTPTLIPLQATTAGQMRPAYLRNFPCDSTPPVMRIVQTTAGTATNLEFAAYYGPATSIGDVPMSAQYWGGMEQAGVAGSCNHGEVTSTGQNNWVDLGGASGCSSWVTTGKIVAVGTNSPNFTLTDMPAGMYKIELQGQVFSSTSSQLCLFRLFDSGNSTGYQSQSVYSNAGSVIAPGLSFHVQNLSQRSNITFKIQAADDGAGSCALIPTDAGRNLSWKVYYFPNESQRVASVDNMSYSPQPFTATLQGFGTLALNSCTESRQTNYLVVGCTFTAGTIASSEARFYLPKNYTISNKLGSKQGAIGEFKRWISTGNSFKTFKPFMVAGQNYITFGLSDYAGTFSPPTSLTGNQMINNGESFDVNFMVPIQEFEVSVNGVVRVDTPIANIQPLTTASGNYTVSANVKWIEVFVQAPGGGGVGSGSAAGTSPTAGGNSTFGSYITATGGGAATFSSGTGLGGTCTVTGATTIANVPGGNGEGLKYAGANTIYHPGGLGGTSVYGGAGMSASGASGFAGAAGSGAGGGGGGLSNTIGYAGQGGGAGAYCQIQMAVTPGQVIPYVNGAAGAAGGAGTGGYAGGAGGTGRMYVIEHFSSMTDALVTTTLAKVLPNTPGAVTSGNTGLPRIEWAAMVDTGCSSDPCVMRTNSGAFTAWNRSSAGSYVLYFPSGTWSSSNKAVCTCTGWRGANAIGCLVGPPTDTYINVQTYVPSTLALQDSTGPITVQCIAPKP